MAYYDAKENVRVEVVCSECGKKDTVDVEIGVNLSTVEVKNIEVLNVS